MSEYTTAVALWALQAAIAGAVLLGLGRIALALCRSPQGKFRISVWTLRAAALVPVLCILPAWWSLPAPTVFTATSDTDARPLREPQLARRTVILEGPVDLPPPMSDAVMPDIVEDFNPFLPNLDAVPTPMPETIVDQPVSPVANRTVEPTHDSADGPLSEDGAMHLPTWHDALWILGIAYIVASLFYALDFVRGAMLLNRLRRESLPASLRVSAAASTLVNGLKPSPRVLTHPSLPSPVCFGVLRPTIVMPKALASALPADELTWVLAHELDHLRRGDPLSGWVAGIVRCFYFFVPMFWGVRRELRTAQELLADAAAVAAGVSGGGTATDYAAFLVRLSSGTPYPTESRALPAHGVRAGRSQLFRRVTMILNTKPGANPGTSPGSGRRWSLLTAGLFLSAAVAASGVNLVQADDAKVNEPDKPKEERKEGEKLKESERKRESEADAKRAEERKRDGDKPRPAERPMDRPAERRDGDRPPEARAEVRLFTSPVDMAKVGELKKKIGEAVQAGNVEAAMKLVNELEKTLRTVETRVMALPPGAPIPPRVPGVPAEPRYPAPALPTVPPVPAMPPAQPFGGTPPKLVFELQQGQMDEAIRALRKAQEAMTDPAAREAFRKAVDQLQWQNDNRVREIQIDPNSVQPMPGGGWGGTGRIGGSGGVYGGTISSGGPSTKAVYGITATPLPEVLAEQLQLKPGEGLVITQIRPESPAAKAGLKVNEVIVKVNGTTVVGGEGALSRMFLASDKESIALTIFRKGQEVKVELPRVKAEVYSFSGGFGGPSRFPGQKVRFDSMSTQVEDGKFEIKAKKGNAVYNINGKLDKGQPTELVIKVTMDGKKITPGDDGRMPGDHDLNVNSLLDTVRGQ